MNAVIISGNQGNLVGAAIATTSSPPSWKSRCASTAAPTSRCSRKAGATSGPAGRPEGDGRRAFVAHGDKINLIYTGMDDMGLGAIRALKAAGKLKNVTVIAHDGYKKGLEAVKNGENARHRVEQSKALAEKVMEIVKLHGRQAQVQRLRAHHAAAPDQGQRRQVLRQGDSIY